MPDCLQGSRKSEVPFGITQALKHEAATRQGQEWGHPVLEKVYVICAVTCKWCQAILNNGLSLRPNGSLLNKGLKKGLLSLRTPNRAGKWQRVLKEAAVRILACVWPTVDNALQVKPELPGSTTTATKARAHSSTRKLHKFLHGSWQSTSYWEPIFAKDPVQVWKQCMGSVRWSPLSETRARDSVSSCQSLLEMVQSCT